MVLGLLLVNISLSIFFNFVVLVKELLFGNLIFSGFKNLGFFFLVEVLLSSVFGIKSGSEIVKISDLIFLIFGVLVVLFF